MTSRQVQIVFEILVPMFSVACLLSVTIYVAVDASDVLVHKTTTEDIDVLYLYGFATANAIIDIASSYVFFRNGVAIDVFYSNVSQKTEDTGPFQATAKFHAESRECPEDAVSPPSLLEHKKVNLNMLSAFTHLTGDSLRTASVFVAALFSTFTGVPSQICDAWAAIAVSISIIFMVIPLMIEIFQSCRKFTIDE